LHGTLSHLLRCTEPVSFVDALQLVRLLRCADELDDAVLASLLQLHERPELTLGGKEVLGDFLRSYAQRLAQERALAERPIKLQDSGKTARAPVGRALEIALDAKQPSSWELVELRGPAELVDKTPAEALRTGAAHRLILRGTGTVVVRLQARGARGGKRFELRVQVETG
jgi:hypothetical protein